MKNKNKSEETKGEDPDVTSTGFKRQRLSGNRGVLVPTAKLWLHICEGTSSAARRKERVTAAACEWTNLTCLRARPVRSSLDQSGLVYFSQDEFSLVPTVLIQSHLV